ncbi:MAG: VIT1/CCC1 transporter family protein, partial [Mycobacterium sp.]
MDQPTPGHLCRPGPQAWPAQHDRAARPCPGAGIGNSVSGGVDTLALVAYEHHHRNLQGGGARAAVFGVSDGLVSNVALILGVAGAHSSAGAVRLA